MNNSKKSEKNPAAHALEAVYVDESASYRELVDTAVILLEQNIDIGMSQLEFNQFGNKCNLDALIRLGTITQNNSEIIKKIIDVLFDKMRDVQGQNEDLALKVVNLQSTIEKLSAAQAQEVRGNA